MTIDPRFAFWFGVWTSVLLLIASGTISFDGALPAVYVPVITKWCAILGAINSTVLTAASGYSSNRLGPMVSAPPAMASTSASTVAKILIAAFALSVLLAGGSAQAQTPRKLNLPIDPLGLNGSTVTGNARQDLQALWAKLLATSSTDLTYASKLAEVAATPSSKIRKQCWDAIIAVNLQASGANLKDAAGNVLVKPDQALFSNIESLAETMDSLSPQGPLFTSCAGAAELAKMNVLQFVSAAITGAAGFAAVAP